MRKATLCYGYQNGFSENARRDDHQEFCLNQILDMSMLDNTAPMGNRAFLHTAEIVKFFLFFLIHTHTHICTFVYK